MTSAACRDKAFTLVEMLLAAVIGALIIVIALTAYQRVLTTRQELNYHSEILAHARYSLNRLRRDLANFYYQSEPSAAAHFQVRKIDQGPLAADRLRFYVLDNPAAADDQTTGDLYEIEYGLSRGPAGEIFLARRQAPLEHPRLGNDKGTLTHLAAYINDLRFECYDGREWQRGWQRDQDLPQRLRIQFRLVDPAGERPDLLCSQELSLGPPRAWRRDFQISSQP